MSGETDLRKILVGLSPIADDADYGFGLVPAGQTPPAGMSIFALMHEPEGTTLIAPSDQLAAAGLVHTPGWSKITLTIHSSLSAVGLTAAVAAALTDAGISANVVAAYYHDHVFVPLNRREDAISILKKLAQTA